MKQGVLTPCGNKKFRLSNRSNILLFIILFLLTLTNKINIFSVCLNYNINADFHIINKKITVDQIDRSEKNVKIINNKRKNDSLNKL